MADLEGGRISSRQFLALLVLARLVAMLIDCPTISGTSVDNDAWIAIALSTLLALAWGLLVVRLSSMFPGMTIIEYSQVILGPWLGRIVGLMLIVFFLHQSAYTAHIGSAAYVSTIMPETPLWVFVVMLTFLCANSARNGLEVLARAGSVSFGITLVLLGLLLVFPLGLMDLGNLLPTMAQGWLPVQDAMLLSFAIFGELVVMTMMIPYMDRPQEAGKMVVYAFLLAGFLFTWFATVLAAVFGPIMSTLIMPAFSLGRVIRISSVAERLEVIPLVAWTLSAGVKQALFLWAAMLGIAQWFRLSELRVLAYPVGALVGALALWVFRSTIDLSSFSTLPRFGAISFLVTVATPLFLYMMALIRRMAERLLKRGG